MTDEAATELIREYEAAAATRGNWDTHWQEIAERVLPRNRTFTTKESKGVKKTDKIFDSTAPLALERFAAAMESMLTPRAQKWHRLRSTNPAINDDAEVKAWFDEVTRILFSFRYSPRANFASQKHEDYMQMGAFGSSSLFIDANPDGGIRYRTVFLGETYFAEDHQGVVDTMYRKFSMTARQAMQRKDWEGNLPEKITKASNPFQEFEFLHVVKRRMDIDPGRADFKGMEYASYYISLEGKVMLSEGGYNTFPFAISRYVTAPRETYGRSPAMLVLPDIKMLNEMSKTDIRAVHKLVDPPLLLRDDGVLGGGSMAVRTTPGGLNYGGVNAEGRQLIQPLQTGARVDIAEEKMERRRQTINDAFLVTLFQILVDNPQMTATEAMLRAQEKGALLGPTMGRQQSESIGPMIEREIDILEQQGAIPPLPGLLAEAQGEYEIEYESPLNRLQRSEEVVGISRTLETVAPFAQIDPSIMNVFNGAEVARLAAEVNGVPQKVLRTEDEVEAMMDAEREAAAEQQAVEQAQPAATALKDVAQAQALLREPVQS